MTKLSKILALLCFFFLGVIFYLKKEQNVYISELKNKESKIDSLLAVNCEKTIEIKYKLKYIKQNVKENIKNDSVIINTSTPSEVELMLRAILKENWDISK